MEQAQTYLILILQDNENLLNYLTGYINQTLYMIDKYPTLKEKKATDNPVNIPEAEKDQLINTAGYFRSYAVRIMVKLKAIKKELKINKDTFEKLETSFKQIKNTSLPELEAAETFTEILNEILAERIEAPKALTQTQQRKDYVDMSSAPSIEGE